VVVTPDVDRNARTDYGTWRAYTRLAHGHDVPRWEDLPEAERAKWRRHDSETEERR
jgi:hypothetical protein